MLKPKIGLGRLSLKTTWCFWTKWLNDIDFAVSITKLGLVQWIRKIEKKKMCFG